MPETLPFGETELVDAAIAWLDGSLPNSWVVERGRLSAPVPPGTEIPEAADALIELKAPNGTYTTLAVEARRSLEPREVPMLLHGLARPLRALANFVPLLVVAPWLSERTRELLTADGLNFLDLTGNARIQLDNPPVFLASAGAARNPEPAPRGRTTLRGARAGRLVRLLADVRPPYGVRELAGASGLTAGYVSRVLDSLDRAALIERGRRGVVETVDLDALLRAWAADYDVFRKERTQSYLFPQGAATALAALPGTPGRTYITGSFAASRLAPVAAPALLAVYCEDPDGVAEALGLLPTDAGANVVLLRPFDEVVWQRAAIKGGTGYVAPSQVAVDCLTGNGRMPSEGEAVLRWLEDHEDEWRAASIEDLATPA